MSKSLKEQSPSDFQDLVTYIHAHYSIFGEIPSADKAEYEDGVPKPLYERAFKDEGFRAALEERGIILKRYEGDDWKSKGLTSVQLLAANQLLDLTDQRTTKKKLQDLQVSQVQYNSWLKDPAFSKYLHQRADQLFGEHKHEATLALLDNIRNGDLKSIMYHNEMLGIYIPQRAGVNQVDVHGLVVKIIEVIDDEIPDGDLKLRIGDRLKKLIAINNVASQMLNPSTISESPLPPVGAVEASPDQPVVVPTRKLSIEEITDSQERLM